MTVLSITKDISGNHPQRGTPANATLGRPNLTKITISTITSPIHTKKIIILYSIQHYNLSDDHPIRKLWLIKADFGGKEAGKQRISTFLPKKGFYQMSFRLGNHQIILFTCLTIGISLINNREDLKELSITTIKTIDNT